MFILLLFRISISSGELQSFSRNTIRIGHISIRLMKSATFNIESIGIGNCYFMKPKLIIIPNSRSNIVIIKVISDLRVELYLCLRIVKYLRTITMLLIDSSVEIKQ